MVNAPCVRPRCLPSLVALAALVVCGTSAPLAPVMHGPVGPGPTALTTPLAIVIHDAPQDLRQHPYTVSLVAASGQTIASATATGRSRIDGPDVMSLPLPVTSSSRTRLYYLDGDAQVRFLTPTGATGFVTRLPGGPRAHVAFAVSPDDRRIAVSVLDYGLTSASPVRMRLYVEDLAGGAHYRALFASTRVFEWPIGWRGVALVLALSSAAYTQNTTANPYSAWDGYHVVDGGTARRLMTLCAGHGDASASGPLVAAGTLCIRADSYDAESWEGLRFFSVRGPYATGTGALSPDGTRIAATDADRRIILLRRAGQPMVTSARGYAQGWLDAAHLVVGSNLDLSGPSVLRLLDVRTGANTPLGTSGVFVGTLPEQFGG